MINLTIDEVSTHNKVNDCWIIIYDEVYDITDFMKNEHSGGYVPLSVAGRDATNLFITTHPSYVKSMLNSDSKFYKKYHVGKIGEKNRSLSNDKLYFELKKEIEEYMFKNNLKARDNILFEFEIIVIILLTIFTYKKMLTSKNPLTYSILHGIIFTFMITRTIHDCNHGGLTKKCRWKRYLFTFVNEVFSSNQSWQAKHNLHHMHTNDLHKDPTVNQIFRLSKKQELKGHHIFQPIYTFVLFCLYNLGEIIGIRYKAENSPEPMHKMYRYFAKMILISWIYASIKFKRFKYFIFSMMLSGFYLGIILTVSHNLYHLTDDYINTKTFLKEQLSTTTDYNSGSKITNFITHGLNHQVIHHLFPSINYHNYPKLTKDILIPFCKKHNLIYHGEKETFFELLYINIVSLYKWSK